MDDIPGQVSKAMRGLSNYIAEALSKDVPPEVAEKGKHHLLDTISAMVSGSELLPGQKAIRYIASQGGTPEASVIAAGIMTSAANAALANGMLAHADETDDSHAPSGMHPGCAIVPAALAMAERGGKSGSDLLRAVILGYDIGTRMNLALGVSNFQRGFRSTHAIGGLFGAAAASGALAGLTPTQIRYMLSYAVQQASGVTCWVRDREHIEKSFVFGGMPARNGVAAATMVDLGCTGVDDVFSGERNFLDAFSPSPSPEVLVKDLGNTYEIMRTNIKKWPVGSPIQAALDSVVAIVKENKLSAQDVEKVTVRLSEGGARTVDNRHMPDINLQHAVATLLVDSGLSFAAIQQYERMSDPAVLDIRKRVELVADSELNNVVPVRQAIVDITTRDGRRLVHRTYAVRGTADNPMARPEVEAKSLELLAPVLGDSKARELVDAVWSLEAVQDIRTLGPLLSAKAPCMRIAHLAVKVDDLDIAGEFYQKAFGFRYIRQSYSRDHHSRHMTDGHIAFALLKYDDEATSKEGSASGFGPGIHHFGFEVADMEAFKKLAHHQGLEVISAPGVIPFKFRLPGGGIAEVAPHFRVC